MKAYIGIDPGASGACVVLLEDGTTRESRFGKNTDKDTWEFLAETRMSGHQIFCVLEQVGAMPGQGVTSMFTFGENVGKIKGMLVAASIPFEEKVPRTWQKALGITPRFKPKKDEAGTEESKPEFKKRLKQKAEQLFPDKKILSDTADAYLIAEFCKRMHP